MLCRSSAASILTGFALAAVLTSEASALSVPGDANLDGVVDHLDAAVLAQHWLRPGSWTWIEGDFTGDGRVDDLDASVLAANWRYIPSGNPSEPTHTPEPASLIIWTLTSLCVAGGVWWRGKGCR